MATRFSPDRHSPLCHVAEAGDEVDNGALARVAFYQSLEYNGRRKDMPSSSPQRQR
jgi:hypothetical protein